MIGIFFCPCLQIVLQFAKTSSALPLVTTAYKENEGRIFGGQFLDGISNAVDAISMTRYIRQRSMFTSTTHAAFHNTLTSSPGHYFELGIIPQLLTVIIVTLSFGLSP